MTKFRGVICPILTPFNKDGSIARDLWIEQAHMVLKEGAHYLSPFGTTGEGPSVSLDERIEAIEWLLDAGIPANRLMPGTGCPSLADTVALTRQAKDVGCSAAMVLPSYFYGASGDPGQLRYFSEIIAATNAGIPLILYNIPQNSGVPISPELAGQLSREFPEVVQAYKDSSGQWDNTEAVLKAAPSLSVFPGSESFLVRGLDAGGAGCISASVNLNAKGIRSLFDAYSDGDIAEDAHQKVLRTRKAIEGAGLIGGMKSALADRSGDARWLNLRAPLLNATPVLGRQLNSELAELNG